jgi:hypothetical protein
VQSADEIAAQEEGIDTASEVAPEATTSVEKEK